MEAGGKGHTSILFDTLAQSIPEHQKHSAELRASSCIPYWVILYQELWYQIPFAGLDTSIEQKLGLDDPAITFVNCQH